MSDLFDHQPDRNQRPLGGRVVATYDYHDPSGSVLFRKVRYSPKGFSISHPDGRSGWEKGIGKNTPRVLYRLPEVLAAVRDGRTIYLCEGEKDADRAVSLGVVATCNFEGAAKDGQTSKWRPAYGDVLRGANVVVICDNDSAGYAHGRAIVQDLTGKAASVKMVCGRVDREHADFSNHVDAGYGLADLVDIDGQDTGYPAQPGSVAVVVRLGDVTPKPVRWLWPARLPAGKLVVLDGDPSLGKSTLAITFAAHITTGKEWPDHTDCPLGDVVYLSAEDGVADTLRPRLDAAGGDPDRVHVLTGVRYVNDGGQASTRLPTLADIAVFQGLITQTRARLLVVDVLMAYLPSKVDSHRDQDVRTVLHQIAELAEETDCTVLLLRHLNKAGTGSPMYRGGGSIGIVGAARAGFLVALDPEDETLKVLACVKNNLAPEPPSLAYRLEAAPNTDVVRVVWQGESLRLATDLLQPETDDRDTREELREWLIDYLKSNGGRAPASRIIRDGSSVGYSKDQLKRAKAKLAKSQKRDMDAGWDWALLPEGSTEGREERSS